jgi:restriction system protein
MSRSRIASVEYAERRQQDEAAAAAARRLERATRRVRLERATQQYLAERTDEARRRTWQLDAQVAELRSILEHGLRRNPRIDIDGLRVQFERPAPDFSSVGRRAVPPDWSRYEPPAPSVLGRVVAGSRYEQQLAAARADYELARADYEKAEAERQRRFADARARYAAQVGEERLRVDEHNRTVDAFGTALRRREPDAVSRYLAMVLEAVPLPVGFPRAVDVVWPVVRFELPDPTVVPVARAIRYDPVTDELHELSRPAVDSVELYRLVVAQVSLLALRDLFAADAGLDEITFRGRVRDEEPVVVTARRGALQQLLARRLPAAQALSELDGDAAAGLRRAS